MCVFVDRAGWGNSTNFWFLSHKEMTDTIMFETNNHIYVKAAGELWSRAGCIPMGGSFSAQAADLHSLWGVYKGRHKFRALGELRISDEGFPFWVSDHGRVGFCHFHDNILVATS